MKISSCLVKLWLRIPEKARDWVWPAAPPRQLNEESQPSIPPLEYKIKPSLIDPTYDEIIRQYEAECERKKGVDTRLAGAIPLTTIALSVVTGVLINSGHPQTVMAYVSIIILVYLVMQLVCAVHAAIRGFNRRSYLQLTPENIRPRRTEGRDAYKRRMIAEYTECVADNSEQNNDKVTDMAVYIRALGNALWAILLLAIILGLGLLLPIASNPSLSTMSEQRSRFDLQAIHKAASNGSNAHPEWSPTPQPHVDQDSP